MMRFLPSDALTGRPRRLSLREITDAVLYIVRAGCARSLPQHDFPAWQSVYYYFISKDYEYLTDTSEVIIQIAMIGIMLHRPAYEE